MNTLLWFVILSFAQAQHTIFKDLQNVSITDVSSHAKHRNYDLLTLRVIHSRYAGGWPRFILNNLSLTICSLLYLNIKVTWQGRVEEALSLSQGAEFCLWSLVFTNAWRTSWGWWDEWDDTTLQTQGSKFKPWMSEAEHAKTLTFQLYIIMLFEWESQLFNRKVVHVEMTM